MVKVRTMVWCVVFLVSSVSLSLFAAQGVINVNTATAEQLTMLPGIGEKTAKAILSYRQANGPFKTLDEVAKVKGISKKKLDKLRQNLSIQGPNTYIPDQKQAREKSSKQKS
ncbi:MAG TPA: helix-hairpin-helix domain-containing protein [Deltaproteobacteria bacterium]|nr:helix-hairpin-helix domain-containing protein [Deltaproteobacteria bacterium]HXK47059.1 helix-hairpin-helix domain-containing protein [Deltaproteobacteria bacterium]